MQLFLARQKRVSKKTLGIIGVSHAYSWRKFALSDRVNTLGDTELSESNHDQKTEQSAASARERNRAT